MRASLLSRREREVLALLDAGVRAKTCALRLGVSEATVRSYIRSILRKLGSHSQLEALAKARQLGLLGRGGANGAQARASGAPRQEEGYRLLAEILAGCLSDEGGDGDGPERAGEAWGRYLVARPPFSPPLSRAQALSELTQLLEGIGFRPHLTGDGQGARVLLRACPFREVAAAHRRVVCSVHRGVIRGALAELGGALTVARLRPLSERDGACALHLSSRETA
jgi:DNA-binding CsgD family transcriptional regulator